MNVAEPVFAFTGSTTSLYVPVVGTVWASMNIVAVRAVTARPSCEASGFSSRRPTDAYVLPVILIETLWPATAGNVMPPLMPGDEVVTVCVPGGVMLAMLTGAGSLVPRS